MSVLVLSFLAFIGAFALIGVASMRERKATTEDYLVASRNVSPWLTALSSAATNNSGFMFIGLLGFAYRFGVQAVWLQAGWVVGDLLAWLFVHRAVRERSGQLGSATVPQLLACDEGGRSQRVVQIAAAVLTVLFLAGYAGAQLKAGSAALVGMFGWHEATGIVLGAAVVVLYCVAGGLRASIWTDAAQAFVMIGALGALLLCAAWQVGGPSALFSALHADDPKLVQWFPDGLRFGFVPYVLGFVFGGLGVVGQPHILVRSMAIESSAAIAPARRVYFLWYVPFSIAAVACGLYARVLVPDLLASGDPGAAERSLPALASLVLPDVLLGGLLAGVFAATMSTADSQILACSAALTQDIAPRYGGSYAVSKLATLVVAALALTLALIADETVFGMVLGAWSALGASLGPVLLVRLARAPLSQTCALGMMITGFVVQLAWQKSGLGAQVFELLPGMVAPLLVYLAYRLRARRAGIAEQRPAA